MGRMKELAWEAHQAGACDATQCVFCADNRETYLDLLKEVYK